MAVAVPVATASGTAHATVHAALSGLGHKQPSLSLNIVDDASFPITAVTVTLPRGLTFSKKAADLVHGVMLNGKRKAHSTVTKGQLVVVLPGTSPHAALSIAGPALTESKGLLKTLTKLIGFNAVHKRAKRVLALKLKLTIDSGKFTSIDVPLTITFQ
jgi:hypothetical protein